MMSNEKPLLGRTILVTRARRDGDELVATLENYGAKVLYSPTIEIIEPETFAPLDEAINNISQYDWLIFTSRNAVEAFSKRLEALEKPVTVLSHLKTLAVGTSTAKAMEKAKINVTLVPEKFNAEGALLSLEKFYQESNLLSKCRFLFPRAALGRDILPLELEKLGAKVNLVVAYQTSIPKGAKEELLKTFSLEKIDLITFTSPSTVNNLVELVSPSSLTDLLCNTKIACIGPVTTKSVQEYGLAVDVCPKESTVIVLAKDIKQALK